MDEQRQITDVEIRQRLEQAGLRTGMGLFGPPTMDGSHRRLLGGAQGTLEQWSALLQSPPQQSVTVPAELPALLQQVKDYTQAVMDGTAEWEDRVMLCQLVVAAVTLTTGAPAATDEDKP